MVVLRESGELESDEPIEQSSFEELNCSYSSPPTPYSPQWGPANFPDFPPSPTYSPLWGPTSFPPSSPTYSPLWGPTSFPPSPPSSSTLSLFGVRTGIDLSEGFVGEPLTLFVDYLIRERGGELNVINGLKGGTLNVINGVNTLNALEFEGRKVLGIDDAYEDYVVKDDSNVEHEDIIDQLVVDCEGVDHRVMGDRGGKLCTISARRVFKINGVEYRQGRISSATSEPSAEFQAKLSARVWLGDRGQWVVDVRHGWNWLNLGIFRTTEGASSGEERARRRGGKDLFDYPRPLLFENGLEPLQLPPTSQEENQDGGIGCEGTGDCAMVDQAQFNSGCLKKRKTREKNPGGEGRNKKAKGVRIEIPLDDILQRNGMCIKDAAIDLKVSKSTLKRICRGYDIYRWPPRKEQELISQSRPNKSPAVVDQEQIPQLNPDTLLPSNQVLPTSDTYSLKVKVKCEEGTIIKFRLSSPWRKIELEQEVKKRLPFEAGTYDIKYKDEIDELILICCDEDLAECISSSSLVDNCSIELFLNLKPK